MQQLGTGDEHQLSTLGHDIVSSGPTLVISSTCGMKGTFAYVFICDNFSYVKIKIVVV